MSVPTKPTVFISYSHKDERWKDRFFPQLRALEQAGQLTVWDDRRIDGGDKWYPEIESAMREATIAICLISPDYLASDFCIKEEVPFLLQRCQREGMIFIPVLLRPCSWRAFKWLSEIQMLPRDGKSVVVDFRDIEDAAFAEVADLVFKLVHNPAHYRPPIPVVPSQLPSERIYIDRLPVTGVELFGRQKELELIDQAWDSDQTNIVSLMAWGGVGKSTLVNKWLERIRADNFRGAQRVFGWSFYSQGTSERVNFADQFIEAALSWFGGSRVPSGAWQNQGAHLAKLIRSERTLLILDGLEPLQFGYGPQKGKIKDSALATLLKELAHNNQGLCVITSRESIVDLNDFAGSLIHKDLEQISDEAGRALLRVGGVQGKDAELEQATRDFGNHALAINLLAVFLHAIAGHHVSNAAEIPTLDISEREGKHPRRVMSALAKRLGACPELEILKMLGLFDRPADKSALARLRRAPLIPGLSDLVQRLSEGEWLVAIEKLRRYRLVASQSRHRPEDIDTHPLVREHFGELTRRMYPEAWRAGNDRLYLHLIESAETITNSTEKLQTLRAAVAHGYEAGRGSEALDQVWERIEESVKGDFGREVAATDDLGLSNFSPVGPVSGRPASPAIEGTFRHPKELYVLSLIEMFERFSFYSMLAIFTIYLRNQTQGFGMTAPDATSLYATYLMFVYVSPLVGGILADWKLGYRKAVTVGSIFFTVGYVLLSFRSMIVVYAALSCLVIGNGFFKPNISTMVGSLYPKVSRLKDRAYLIFYVGISIGAFVAPIVMEIVSQKVGYHPAFVFSALGTLMSVALLWKFKDNIRNEFKRVAENKSRIVVDSALYPAPPDVRPQAIESVQDWKRNFALIVLFLIIIVFWMAFHQNGSTLVYWSEDYTAWNVSGIVQNAINPFWLIALAFPLCWFWQWLDHRGKEPTTLAKMATGMFLTALSFFVMFEATRQVEAYVAPPGAYVTGTYRFTEREIRFLQQDGVPDDVLATLKDSRMMGRTFATDSEGPGEVKLTAEINAALGPQATQYQQAIIRRAFIAKVSPLWLILAYMITSLAELMLYPMGLSLVSKVASARRLGTMMGVWFLAIAIGNKLTTIGLYWEIWAPSSFFLVLAAIALSTALVVVVLMKPLQRMMGLEA